jgi:hypothetical protein
MDGVSGNSGGGDIGGTIMEIIQCVLMPHKLLEKLFGGGDSVSQSQQAATGTAPQATDYSGYKDGPGYFQGRSHRDDVETAKDLEVIEKNFDLFDTANGKEGKDGKVSPRELEKMVDDPSLPQELRDAARKVLNSGQLILGLDSAITGIVDGGFTKEELKVYRSKLMESAGLTGMETPEQTKPAEQGTKTTDHPRFQAIDEDKGISPAVAQSQSAMTSVLDDPNISFEGKTNYLCGEALQASEDEAVGAYKEYEAAYDKLKNATTEQERDLAQADVSRLNSRVQRAIQSRQEMFTMMTNINSMSHDMAMAAIRNMKD